MTGPTMSSAACSAIAAAFTSKFNTDDDGCVWNLKIEWADPGYPGVLWNDVDLCKISTLRLRYNRATDTTSYLAE
jgi:hypothetical protein